MHCLPEVLREAAEPDGGEEVDGEARVHGVVPRHDALEGLGERRVAQALVQLGHAHVLGQLLEVRMRLKSLNQVQCNPFHRLFYI